MGRVRFCGKGALEGVCQFLIVGKRVADLTIRTTTTTQGCGCGMELAKACRRRLEEAYNRSVLTCGVFVGQRQSNNCLRLGRVELMYG